MLFLFLLLTIRGQHHALNLGIIVACSTTAAAAAAESSWQCTARCRHCWCTMRQWTAWRWAKKTTRLHVYLPTYCMLAEQTHPGTQT
jgi:hypothetical protein